MVAYSANKPASTLKTSNSGPDGTWEKRGFWPWQRTYKVAVPTWEDHYYWNGDFYRPRTNCYAYALNIKMNPFTNKEFLGDWSQKENAHSGLAVGEFSAGRIEGKAITKSSVIAHVDLDLQMLGRTMEQATIDTPVPKGKWKIAIAISNDSEPQYHFYRQDADGTWSHKPGKMQATQLDASGHVITNPETADGKYSGVNYNVFCGYFIIGPN